MADSKGTLMNNRRRYKRFSATAFLNVPVDITPFPPFFGSSIKGKVIDLSAGGMAILIKEAIPMDRKLFLTLRFPDDTRLSCAVQVRYVMPREKRYLHGIEFLDLAPDMMQKIDRMSNNYIDCEYRIQAKAVKICTATCSFYSMCTKPQKKETLTDPLVKLELVFQQLEEISPSI